MQMEVARALEWLHLADRLASQPKQLGCLHRKPLLLGVALPAPVYERATKAQERRCVLEHDRLRRHRSSQHEVVGADSLRPLLHSSAHRLGILDPSISLHALDKRALARLALHELNLAMRKRHSERKPGKAGARANISDLASFTHKIQLKRHERVSEMDIDSACRLPDGGGRELIHSQRAQNLRQLVQLAFRQPIAFAEAIQQWPYVGVRMHRGFT